MGTFEDFWSRRQELFLRDRIAPENRGVAALLPSHYVIRGEILRFIIEGKPRILINTQDVEELRDIIRKKSPYITLTSADQTIADIAEQLFAEWGAKRQ